MTVANALLMLPTCTCMYRPEGLLWHHYIIIGIGYHWLTDSPIVACGEDCVEGGGVVISDLSGPASTSKRERERERERERVDSFDLGILTNQQGSIVNIATMRVHYTICNRTTFMICFITVHSSQNYPYKLVHWQASNCNLRFITMVQYISTIVRHPWLK